MPDSIEKNLIRRDRPLILGWLLTCLALIALMVLIGGYTRLSGSGLSITQWKPIHGTLPPMNADQWNEEFTAYQQSPQYIKVNSGMTLDDFKTIFWPEFIHRLLGRAIGMVFFLPLIIFAARKSISRRFGWRLAFIFALGGMQGLIGWLMVKSGLQDDPHVSPIRLALHLSAAFALFALILWAVLDIKDELSPRRMTGSASPRTTTDPVMRRGDSLRKYYPAWFALLCLQIIMGAFMAGIHGGLIYNTWPLMDGQFIPDGLLATHPWYANIPLIQLIHRTLAIALAATYLLAWFPARKILPKSATALVHTLLLQFALGVTTLLYQAPLPLALAHQMAGLLLFCLSIIVLHRSCESLATLQIS